MSCSTSSSSSVRATLIVALVASFEGCAAAHATAHRRAPLRFALLPTHGLSGARAPLREVRRSLEEALKAEGIELVGRKDLEAFLARGRIRHTGGIDGVAGAGADEALDVDGVLVSSVLEWRSSFPPKFGLSLRVVSAEPWPRILWMRSVSRSGDEAPGVFDLGIVRDVQILKKRVTAELAHALSERLDGVGTDIAQCPGDSHFTPQVNVRRGALVPSTEPRVVAVLPFRNHSQRRDAGQLMALQFVAQIAAMDGLTALEPGVIRRELLAKRIIMEDGIGLDQARLIEGLVGADFVLTGTVFEYEEHGESGGVPHVDFSAMMLNRRAEDTLWQVASHHRGDDPVYAFKVGSVRTAPQLSCEMVSTAAAAFGATGAISAASDWVADRAPRARRRRLVARSVTFTSTGSAPSPHTAATTPTSSSTTGSAGVQDTATATTAGHYAAAATPVRSSTTGAPASSTGPAGLALTTQPRQRPPTLDASKTESTTATQPGASASRPLGTLLEALDDAVPGAASPRGRRPPESTTAAEPQTSSSTPLGTLLEALDDAVPGAASPRGRRPPESTTATQPETSSSTPIGTLLEALDDAVPGVASAPAPRRRSAARKTKRPPGAPTTGSGTGDGAKAVAEPEAGRRNARDIPATPAPPLRQDEDDAEVAGLALVSQSLRQPAETSHQRWEMDAELVEVWEANNLHRAGSADADAIARSHTSTPTGGLGARGPGVTGAICPAVAPTITVRRAGEWLEARAVIDAIGGLAPGSAGLAAADLAALEVVAGPAAAAGSELLIWLGTPPDRLLEAQRAGQMIVRGLDAVTTPPRPKKLVAITEVPGARTIEVIVRAIEPPAGSPGENDE